MTSRPCPHPRRRRTPALLAAALVAAACATVSIPASAGATSNMTSIIQDGGALKSDPTSTLSTFHMLGPTTLRVIVIWSDVAPNAASFRRPHFKSADPGAYPADNWAPYDQIVRQAQAQGYTVDFDVAGGAPLWADGKNPPKNAQQPHFAWKPKASEYAAFVTAIGKRYNGKFKPKGQNTALPRVHFWSLWNEPNFGQDLGPQATDGSKVSVAPMMYRGLVDAGWKSLHQTGHGSDTILIGEFAAEGRSGPVTKKHPQGLPGYYAQTKPLQFLRTLYCVDTKNKALSGQDARDVGCPTNASGYRAFRNAHPGLFNASGMAIHPYASSFKPVEHKRIDPDYAVFPQLGKFERTVDAMQNAHGSGKRYKIYSTEYGYITRPPKTEAQYPTQSNAAFYLNWAEYVSYKSPRLVSYAQYLLKDPVPLHGSTGFASGLYTSKGVPKQTFYAYRMPIYTPKTNVGRNENAEVWGGARPAHFAALATKDSQPVQIQLQRNGSRTWTTLSTVTAAKLNGYFDTHLKIPASGKLRLAYSYPKDDPLLPMGFAGDQIYSRTVKVTVH